MVDSLVKFCDETGCLNVKPEWVRYSEDIDIYIYASHPSYTTLASLGRPYQFTGFEREASLVPALHL